MRRANDTDCRTETLPLPVPRSLTRQLIAYIGNKRRLLGFLSPILSELLRRARHAAGAGAGGIGPLLLDPLCGSGAVSRLARHLGFRVAANDWEPFAAAVTAPYLENRPEDLQTLFGASGGVESVLDDLNRFGHGTHGAVEPYIAHHYAPESTEAPRIGSERLFYTAENARFIDRVRTRIDERFPEGATDAGDRARRALLALLLYEASTHTNTSGVFKAYHRGFGGHGRDALPRILAPMELERPAFFDGPPGYTCSQDAGEFVAGRPAEVCYLDPPYSSHQYGSNYFMLNTIVLWDRPEVSEHRDGRGNLTSKAGIRPDWVETRSPFCYRRSALAAFRSLVDRIDARHIVVSYSSAGIIPISDLIDALADHGDPTLHVSDYTAYRGGRQSLTRSVTSDEFVIVVERTREHCGHRAAATRHMIQPEVRNDAGDRVRRQLAEREIVGLLAGRFVPQRLRSAFTVRDGTVQLAAGLSARSVDWYRLDTVGALDVVPGGALATIREGLLHAACRDHAEELDVLMKLIRATDEPERIRSYGKRLLWCLRKYAHRKYRAEFE